MSTTRGAWSLAGLVAGAAGLASSYAFAMVTTIGESPVIAVAELVVRLSPGPVAELAIDVLGSRSKTVLRVGVFVVLALLFAWAGRLARRTWWRPLLLLLVIAAIGAVALVERGGSTVGDVMPVPVGLVTWLACLPLLVVPLRRADRAVVSTESDDHERRVDAPAANTSDGSAGDHNRRAFLLRSGLVVAASAAVTVVGKAIGSGRRHVEETRRLLRLPGVSAPRVPAGARLRGVRGLTPWMTPADDFYRIDTAVVVPAIEPDDWELRIHGMVDRELVLGYDQLVRRQFTEAWVTLTCVSNPVGGSLAGNAWWSGVRLADLLAEAGVQPGADAVLQTSHDGWTCVTPLDAMTGDAMLAVAMNGQPLPLDHGFPVRTVVPGLYGYVSATKWVVDLEVTRFADATAYWTKHGWAERAPVKLASRVDVPRAGEEVPAGDVVCGGVAWAQGVGVAAVQVSVDGGEWVDAETSTVPSVDTWVQWRATVSVGEGEHMLRVRAVDRNGQVQTSVERSPLPDGATGWHGVEFTTT